MTDLTTVIKNVLKDVTLFSHHVSGTKLRSYQMTVAAAIANSVIYKKGLSFVVVFPRQSGKNELQAQIETYLLTLLQRINAEIVKVSPTWKPQSSKRNAPARKSAEKKPAMQGPNGRKSQVISTAWAVHEFTSCQAVSSPV